MWTSKIVGKVFAETSLDVNVNFSNGERDFNLIFRVASTTELESRIRVTLAQLQSLDTFAQTVSLGDFTPPPVEEKPKDLKQEALNNVANLKNLISLGLLKEDSQEYVDAVALYKSL